MLKVDKVRKKQAAFFYIADYLWGGFATLSVIFVLIAFWQLGTDYFGEFLLPSPLSVFKRTLSLLNAFRTNEIDISLRRALIGVGSSLILGLSVGMIAGRFRTLMALFKPLMTVLLSTPPIIWVVMALFWFGFGDASVLFTIMIIVTPLTFASAAVGIASIDKQSVELFDTITLDDKKGNGAFWIIFATPLLLPARVNAPQDARTPFRVYNCALRKSNGTSNYTMSLLFLSFLKCFL